MKPFNPIEQAVREATVKELQKLGIKVPSSYLGFEIPVSIRKDTDRDDYEPDYYND